MEKKHVKKFLIVVGVGAAIEFLCVFLTGLFGALPVVGGLKLAIKEYFAVWGHPSTLAFICVGIYLYDLISFIVHVAISVRKKEYLLIVAALCLFLAIAFIPFLLLLAFPQLEANNVSVAGMYIIAFLFLMNIASICILSKPVRRGIYRPRRCCHEQEAREEAQEQQPVEEAKEEPKEEVKEEAKEEPAPAPVEEEPAEESVQEEAAPVEEAAEEEEEEGNAFGGGDEIIKEGEIVNEEEYEIVEVIDENGEKVRVKRRRKASFETRLKGSEFDLRHKYYDLRDYIKWYGLTNRVSLPGDTFSYKRKKIAFITIIGKRIKFYIALDPAKYEDSPIPVERATAKKYADTPCVMKVKSDLSYRRAKKLVDEAMKEAGVARPEGEEPKETQHPEQ